jgi:hypothetical protein
VGLGPVQWVYCKSWSSVYTGWWKNPYHISTASIRRECQQGDGSAQSDRDNRGGLGDGECIYVEDSEVDR